MCNSQSCNATDDQTALLLQSETAQAESTARRLLRAEGTREGLYAIMSAMRDVRARESVTEAMFGPLHGCVALLQKYGIMVSTVACCTQTTCCAHLKVPVATLQMMLQLMIQLKITGQMGASVEPLQVCN